MGGQFVERVRAFVSTRRTERLTLLYGLLTGILGVGLAVEEFLDGHELDYQAYYFAGRAVLQGEPFVGWAITEGTFLTGKAYVYTPITAPVFAFYGLFPQWQVGYVINVALLFVVFCLLSRLILQFIDGYGVELERADRLLLVGFCLLSGHSILAMYRGNVDPIMLLLLAVGLLAIERGDEWKGGALWAVAAHFKLFPAFLGVWLLYRRAYRAIAAAVVTGLGLLALGVALFGVEAHLQFVEFILEVRSREGAFEGGLDPTLQWITLRRPFSQLGMLNGDQLFLLTTVLIAPVVYLVYREADTELDHVVAFFATMAALLITIVPSTLNYVVYLYFPLLPLLYLTDDTTTKRLFAVGLVLTHLPVYPQHVALLVDAVPLAPGVGNVVVAAARTVLTYTSIPLLGFLCILGGCLRFVRASGPSATPASADTSVPE